MAKQSSVNLDITNNADGFDISGGTTVRKLGITGGDVTIAGSGSAVVTFPTTSTTIAGLGITQSFSALQSFSAGISAAGGVTFAGTLQGTTAAFTGLVSSTVGFSGPGTNITGVVTSFNNQTGAVTGVTVGGTNVFTALNTFNVGISAAGGVTFSGNVAMTSTSSHTGLASFVAGISASGGVTLNGYLTGTTAGFQFGFTTGASGYIKYATSAYPTGGLLLTGSQIFQIGGGPNIANGAGFLNVDPNAERMLFNGRTEFYINQGYQSAVSPLSIAIGTAHTGQPIRIAKQSTTGSIDTATLIAGCDSNGIWYGAGFSGGTGGTTFSGNVAMTSTSSHTGLASFAGGISASGGTFGNNIFIKSREIGFTSSNVLFGTNAGSIITSGTNNILIGLCAGLGITNQSDNISIGNDALRSTTPTSRNVALGTSALLNNTRDDIVGIGSEALYNNTGLYTVGLGTRAGYNNSGSNVLAIGYQTLASNAASNQVAIGPYALYNNTNSSASQNVAIGLNSMWTNSGAQNVAIGNDTLIGTSNYLGQSGNRNTVMGYRAGYNNRTGSDNVFIGNQAGLGISSGNSNIYIGSGVSGSTLGTVSNEIVIGTNAVGFGSNTTTIGPNTQTSATIYGTLNVPSGISCSGGFTFGSPSGTTFMVFVPQTSCSNGGLWIRDGNFQIGGSALSAASGSFFYSPCGERFDVYGYATFNNSYNYQAGRAVLRLNGAPTQSVPILAAYKQTSDGTQLTNTFTTTNMVAGIDQNGALFSSVGISAAGGITFTNNVQANGYILSSNARSWFL